MTKIQWPTKQGWATILAGLGFGAVALAKFWLKQTTLPDPVLMGAPIASSVLIVLSHYTQAPDDAKYSKEIVTMKSDLKKRDDMMAAKARADMPTNPNLRNE